MDEPKATEDMTMNQANVIERNESGSAARGERCYFRPPSDFFAFNDRFEIHADVPGATPEGISLTIDDGVLTVEARVEERYPPNARWVQGEFGVGDYRRAFRLGEDVDQDHITASCHDGVLTIVLPKRTEKRAQRVPVRGG